MSRILAIDYGKKRTGLAWTDPLRITANPLEMVGTETLEKRLQELVMKNDIGVIVVGYPTREDGTPTHTTEDVDKLLIRLKELFQSIDVISRDERYTSKIAMRELIRGGTSKKKRRDKGLIDQMSATIILQEYLEEIQ